MARAPDGERFLVCGCDYAVVQAVVLVVATVYIPLNLLSEILYVMVDPRLRT